MRNLLLVLTFAGLAACATQPSQLSDGPKLPANQRAFAQESSVIRSLRVANNLAMARRDLDGTMSIVADDYVNVGGGGGIMRSFEEARQYWSNTFSDPSTISCVRNLQSIEVGESADEVRAAERGQWTCPKSTVAGEAVYHGVYFAHWRKKAGHWRVVSDNYVRLGCRGSGCPSR